FRSFATICDAEWDPRVRRTVGDCNDREETSGHFGIFFATWRRKGGLGRAFALAMRDPLNERRVLARRDHNQQYDKGYYHIQIGARQPGRGCELSGTDSFRML